MDRRLVIKASYRLQPYFSWEAGAGGRIGPPAGYETGGFYLRDLWPDAQSGNAGYPGIGVLCYQIAPANGTTVCDGIPKATFKIHDQEEHRPSPVLARRTLRPAGSCGLQKLSRLRQEIPSHPGDKEITHGA